MPVDDFTDDELNEMAAGHLLNEAQREALAEGDGDDGRWRYERVPIKGAVSRGAFRLPGRVIDTLGKGDPRTGGAIAAHLFRVDPDDPLTISPDKVRDLGHGDIGAGQRVLRKFVAMLRKSGAQSTARQR